MAREAQNSPFQPFLLLNLMDEAILSLLKQHKGGLAFHQIASLLRARGRDKTRLRARLKSLQSQGLLLKRNDRYSLPPAKNVVRGVFLATGKGYGFVRMEESGGEDIFVPARHSLGALTGDAVEVAFLERGMKGKPEGRVVRIIELGRLTVIGTYSERLGQPFLVPFDAASAGEIPLKLKGPERPKPGMIVEAQREGRLLLRVLGFPDDAGVDTDVVIHRFNLATDFSPEALAEAERISGRIPVRERDKRKDFRRWLTVTIDGENAQDFDDAVSIKKLASGRFLLGVHIADVSHYVRPGSGLDREAFRRGTSVYFPDLTLPMLPEKLSNDVCSLRPRKTRLTVSALLEIDEDGRVVGAEFHPSLIRTAERLTYTSVFKIFEEDETERQRYIRIVPDLLLMREVARRLRSRREEEGSLNFDLVEPELVYKEGRLQAVAAFEANEAHHLIEEFMVAANVAVAQTLHQRSQPAIYRVHPPPSPADLEELRGMLAHFGLLLPRPPEITSKSLQRILSRAEGNPAEKFIHFQVLRALRLAVYSDENTGHYGLAKKEYTHFTSPIRRYPDLVIHRALKAVLEDRRMNIPGLQSIALHSSEQERKADEAERELVEWRIFRLLKEKLGDEFQGTIVDFTKAGVVVELDDYFVEGLIPYADLDGDYYRRRSRKTLTGRRTRRAFELGELVRVILASVDPVSRRMSLVLAGKDKGGKTC